MYTVGTGDGPVRGALTLNPDGTFTYAPEPGFRGSDAFTYTLTDVDGDTASATVDLEITNPDLASGALSAAARDFAQARRDAVSQGLPFTVSVTPSPVQIAVPSGLTLRMPATLNRSLEETDALDLPAAGAAFQWARAEGRSLSVRPDANENRSGQDKYAKNLKPRILARDKQIAPEGRLAFDRKEGNPIRLQDVNDEHELVRVTLQVEHGRITLGTERGITFEKVVGRIDQGKNPDEEGRTTAMSFTIEGTREAIEAIARGPDLPHRDGRARHPRHRVRRPRPRRRLRRAAGLPHHRDRAGQRADRFPPSDLAEVETDAGHLGTGLLGAGFLGLLFRRRKTGKQAA